MDEAPTQPHAIEDIWSFVKAIDWEREQWLWYLLGFHVLCLVASLLSRGRQNLQIFLFFTFLILIFCAEYINEWAANNHRLFSRQQYFDSGGLFISLLFSTPLLIDCVIILVCWLSTLMSMAIIAKRAKMRHEATQQQKKDE